MRRRRWREERYNHLPPKGRLYLLPRGLCRTEALKRARQRDGYRDFRGFDYNPKTGVAIIT